MTEAMATIPPKIGKFKAGWLVLKESSKILNQDRELMAFPVMAFFAGIAVMLVFGTVGYLILPAVRDTQYSNFVDYAYLFLYYLATYFIVNYYGCALAASAIYRFKGNDPDVKYGLTQARAKVGTIFGFSIIAATVGVILQIIRDRQDNWVGEVVASILGAAWSIVTLFVRPAIVMTDLGPIEAIKHSASTFKKAWGENFVGGVSLSLITFLLMIVAMLPLLVGFALISHGLAYLVGGGLFTLIAAVGLSIYVSTLSSIFNAALYLYATTGQVPSAFDATLIKGAFVPKARV